MNGDKRSPTRGQRADDALLANENMSVVHCKVNDRLTKDICTATHY